MLEVDEVIRFRLSTQDIVPSAMVDWSVGEFQRVRLIRLAFADSQLSFDAENGRVTFNVPNRYRCSLTVGGAGQPADEHWFILDFEFLLTVTGQGKTSESLPRHQTALYLTINLSQSSHHGQTLRPVIKCSLSPTSNSLCGWLPSGIQRQLSTLHL